MAHARSGPSRLRDELAAMTNAERAALPVMAPGRGDVIVAGAVDPRGHDAPVRRRARARERDRHPRRLGPRDARPVTSAAVCRSAPGTSSSRSWRRAARPSGRRPSAAGTSRWASSGAVAGLALLVAGLRDPDRRRRRRRAGERRRERVRRRRNPAPVGLRHAGRRAAASRSRAAARRRATPAGRRRSSSARRR